VTRVGFIGLGSQGGAMARAIVDHGHDLTLWARRPETLQSFDDTAARVAATPAELGGASEIVGICVMADADVEDVVLRDDGVLAGMADGGVIIIHSTIHPDTCRRVAAIAAYRGISVLDAPVSGGGGAAAEQRLLVMAGGDADVLDRARPVLETFANPIIHLGPVGSGQTAKLINNLVFTAQLTLAFDTFEFADRIGVDRAALAQVLSAGSGGSKAADILSLTGFDISGIAGARPLLLKDVTAVLAVAEAAGASRPAELARLAQITLASLEGKS